MLGSGRGAIDQVADPREGVWGFVQIVAANTLTQVPLFDAEGNVFVPTALNPFGIKDIIVKNTHGTNTSQWEIFIGTDQLISFYCAPTANVKISFNGVASAWDIVYAQNDIGLGYITLVGVQN